MKRRKHIWKVTERSPCLYQCELCGLYRVQSLNVYSQIVEVYYFEKIPNDGFFIKWISCEKFQELQNIKYIIE
jgi:hypothetical protein